MPEDVFVYLGQCLRDAREECGLTQQELADQTGRGLRHLQDIEKGRKNPSYDVLASFIKRLGITMHNNVMRFCRFLTFAVIGIRLK